MQQNRVLTLVPRIVIDRVLEDGDGQVQELLGVPYVTHVEHVDQRGQVHRMRDHGQVVSVVCTYVGTSNVV